MAKQTLPTPKHKTGPTSVKAYLVAYNVLSSLGWAYVLGLTLIHVFNLDDKSDTVPPPKSISATTILNDFLFSSSSSSSFSSRTLESHLPPALKPIYARSTTTYSRVGPQTAFVQSFAFLEVIHVLLGWVKSPLSTTLMQVSSRLFLVWGVTEQFPEARSNPLYTSMIFAWSTTEVIRYAFYAFNLLGKNPPYPLLWLRYTTFYVLYIIGASSEALVNYSSLPSSSPIPGKQTWLQGAWQPYDYMRALLFAIWWPGLYFLYTHMIRQRRKVLGQGRTLKRD